MKREPDQDEMQHLATNLRIAMIEKSWSQVDLADAAKVQQSLISRILCGKSDPCISSLSRLAKALNVKIDALLSPPPRKKLRDAS
jgi:transcriptional regulator with XRE-family HTH domain